MSNLDFVPCGCEPLHFPNQKYPTDDYLLHPLPMPIRYEALTSEEQSQMERDEQEAKEAWEYRMREDAAESAGKV